MSPSNQRDTSEIVSVAVLYLERPSHSSFVLPEARSIHLTITCNVQLPGCEGPWDIQQRA